MSAIITIEFVVPLGYQPGDYAQLYGDSGSGDINWDTPITAEIFQLFPNGCGIYCFGHTPWGHFRWGHPWSMRTPGWEHLPWGNFPWGHGTAIIRATVKVEDCGTYKFAFIVYDKLDNANQGTPEQATITVDIHPPAPTGLTKNSYDKDTDILILDAA
jgi:hypothetical protein